MQQVNPPNNLKIIAQEPVLVFLPSLIHVWHTLIWRFFENWLSYNLKSVFQHNCVDHCVLTSFFMNLRCTNINQELTLGKSLRWLASKSNSSRLLAYLMISSGTWERLQWRLSIYSTCRLQPLNNGIHLNIFMSNGFNNCRAQLNWHCLLSNWNQNLIFEKTNLPSNHKSLHIWHW